ncbi:MAG: DUF1835 domain-containing protein [Candidatus Phaeomarinobacter sp.]
MPSDKSNPPHDYFDGRLNLDQQKRRAKDLLKSVKAGQPESLARLAAHAACDEPARAKLSDAQLVLARENGFASWPKLKFHCDGLAEKRRQTEAGTPPILDTPDTLHIRCGSDIHHSLKLAGFKGAFLEFADPFCQGPVPAGPQDAMLAARAQFLSEAYGIELKDAQARQQREYDALAAASDRSHVVMWFEHDSYDQLILARLLTHFAGALRPERLDLICVDHVPGVPGFTGLGQLAPEVLIWLWETQRKPVSQAQLEFGQGVWTALRSPDPRDVFDLCNAATDPIPQMGPALRRHLQELPSALNGMSLTQSLTLQILADRGAMTGGSLFGVLARDYEPLPFLGDLMYWHILADMQKSDPAPLDVADTHLPWPKRLVDISAYGADLLSGRRDFLDTYRGERWVGGVSIDPHNEILKTYRWDLSDSGQMHLF